MVTVRIRPLWLRPIAGGAILLAHAALLLGAPWPADEQPAVSAPLAVTVIPAGRTTEAIEAPQIAQLAEASALEAQASAAQPAQAVTAKPEELAPTDVKEERAEPPPNEQRRKREAPERTEFRASEVSALSAHGEMQAAADDRALVKPTPTIVPDMPHPPPRPKRPLAKDRPKQRERPAHESSHASAASRASAVAHHSTAETVTGSVASATYRSIVSAELNRRKFYPPDARAAGTEGVVTVSFTVGPSGRVANHSIIRSSGAPALDRAVDRMMAALALPPPPGGHFRATVPIRFDLAH
jgi:protein TonB